MAVAVLCETAVRWRLQLPSALHRNETASWVRELGVVKNPSKLLKSSLGSIILRGGDATGLVLVIQHVIISYNII